MRFHEFPSEIAPLLRRLPIRLPRPANPIQLAAMNLETNAAQAVVPQRNTDPRENVILLPQGQRRRKEPPKRFKILEFTNRAGTQSWRVSGTKRDGTRVRKNYADPELATAFQAEMELEYLGSAVTERTTKTALPEDKVRLAEVAFLKLGDDWERILDAVDHWKLHGQELAPSKSPNVDDAVADYIAWLEATPSLRDATKRHWKTRMAIFRNSIPNMRVCEVTIDTVENYLNGRRVSAVGKDTDKRAISRFFSWCMERPRRWCALNPCHGLKVEQGKRQPPTVLTFSQCKTLLHEAEKHRDGRLVPYIAVCLFAGLRPFEAQRLKWEQVNLKDKEIRLEANQTKTGESRVVTIKAPLDSWLKAYKAGEFFPANWRKDFDIVKESIGYGTATKEKPHLKPWPDDVLRHTAISNFFRDTGSYGLTAEQFGNSEKIIKDHYHSRISSEDAKRFYALRPTKTKGTK